MTPELDPVTDPLVEEVRARRAELLASVGGALFELAREIQRLEATHPHKLVDRRSGDAGVRLRRQPAPDPSASR
jgi:hypothetical protein